MCKVGIFWFLVRLHTLNICMVFMIYPAWMPVPIALDPQFHMCLYQTNVPAIIICKHLDESNLSVSLERMLNVAAQNCVKLDHKHVITESHA